MTCRVMLIACCRT